MELVKQEAKRLLGSNLSSEFDLQFGTSPDGIHYAILTTKGLWYKVRVIGNIEGRRVDLGQRLGFCDIYGFKHDPTNAIAQKLKQQIDFKIVKGSTEHATEQGAVNQIQKCKDEIQNGIYNSMFPDPSSEAFRNNFYFAKTSLPCAAISSPDNYLIAGDIICTRVVAASNHYGIYIGDGNVVHVSGQGDGNATLVARMGSLCPDFVNNDGFIEKLVFSYALRKPEKIVEIAKGFASPESRKDEYSGLYRRFQHFVTLSALGLELSPDESTALYKHNVITDSRETQ